MVNDWARLKFGEPVLIKSGRLIKADVHIVAFEGEHVPRTVASEVEHVHTVASEDERVRSLSHATCLIKVSDNALILLVCLEPNSLIVWLC